MRLAALSVLLLAVTASAARTLKQEPQNREWRAWHVWQARGMACAPRWAGRAPHPGTHPPSPLPSPPTAALCWVYPMSSLTPVAGNPATLMSSTATPGVPSAENQAIADAWCQ